MSVVTSKPGQMIEVEWYDSERVMLGWATRDEYIEALNERSVYRTAGYFVGEDSDHVMVSHSKSDSGNYSDAMVIPLAVVIRVTPLAASATDEGPRRRPAVPEDVEPGDMCLCGHARRHHRSGDKWGKCWAKPYWHPAVAALQERP